MHYLRDDDLTHVEQDAVLRLAASLKADRPGPPVLAGRTVAVIFDKPSTRTRVSFAVGINELGGQPLIIEADSSQLSRGEMISDTARVLDRQVAAIVWRTFGQDRLEAMARVSAVPVINALTNEFHPCQVLADLLTIKERRGSLRGVTLTYLGDGGNNMAHSYLIGCALAGMNIRIAAPRRFGPAKDVVQQAERIALSTGGSVLVSEDPETAAGSDVLATDTWMSIGQPEDEEEIRAKIFKPYAIEPDTLRGAAPHPIVLHCLPAYRGKEIAAEVIDGPHAAVWDEAENRLHVQKALLVFLLAKMRRRA
jgi:ornithine carbamoyltransferase